MSGMRSYRVLNLLRWRNVRRLQTSSKRRQGGLSMLPEVLNPSNYDLRHISLKDTEFLFKQAKKLNVVDEFADKFWTALSVTKEVKPSLQECVYLLEEQKRQLGRKYDKMRSSDNNKVRRNYVAMKYNEIEHQIRWLISTFDLYRTSEPYLLEVK